MRRQIAAILVAGGMILPAFGAASAAGPSDSLVGGYKYHTFTGGARQVSISAHAAGSVTGSWAFQDLRGMVTCLVVDGNEAWAAGPGASGPGAFFYVIDGGASGEYDVVVTWGQDPWQPLEELIGWCQTKNTDFPLFAVEKGNVTVLDAP